MANESLILNLGRYRSDCGMNIVLLTDRTGGPLYMQVAEQIRTYILDRKLMPGDALPTVRNLASELKVGRMTISRAYEELEHLGFVRSKPGSGTVVQEPTGTEYGREVLYTSEQRGPFSSFESTVTKSGLRSLATAMPDPTLFDGDELLAYYADLRGCDPWLYYSEETLGNAGLRTAIQEIMLGKGVTVPMGSIAVTEGLESALQVVISSLTQAGETVLVQDPLHMVKPAELIAKLGRVPVHISCDKSGFDLEALSGFLRFSKLLILSGGFTMPFGTSLKSDHVREVVSLARKHGVLILELDPFGWLNFDQHAPMNYYSDASSDQVIYCGSFDHCLSAGIRSGWLCCPPPIIHMVEDFLFLAKVCGSPLAQQTLGNYCRDGKMDAHRQRVLPEYRARRNTMHRALTAYFPPGCTWTRPAGGLTFWIKLPSVFDIQSLMQKSIERGVIFCPGHRISSQIDADQHIRLGFGLLGSEGIHESVKTLGELIQRL